MATTSLISLVQLLDKVKNMVISDHIQQEVSAKLLIVSLFDVNSHTPFFFFFYAQVESSLQCILKVGVLLHKNFVYIHCAPVTTHMYVYFMYMYFMN